MNDLIDGVRISGEIRLDGRNIYGRGTDVIALRKRMAMVFQKPNPFPMSVFENVISPLRVDGIGKRSVLEEAAERALKGAALWDEVTEPLSRNTMRMYRRPTQ